MTGILDGKTALVFGVANRRSIAWAIAQALAGAGATLAFTYQGERIESGVRELAGSVGGKLVLPCDVTRDEDLDTVFGAVDQEFGGLDILIHAVAFAAREDLEGRFTDTKRSNFAMALDISAYSLTAMVKRAERLMEKKGGGSVVTMTYLGGERAVQNYNVMGVAKAALDASVRYLAMELGEKKIRVNAISAGPIRTLAARSISGFTVMEEHYEKRAPLRRNVDAGEVGQTALFLASDMSSGITGELIHVDSGYHAIGF
jgi:enoyl-[acyl-carrier protein] reductase I